VAWRVLVRVERDRAFADRALDAELRSGKLPARDRALATEIAYGTLRLRGRVDAVLAHVLDRDLSKLEARIRNLLRLGTYQLLFLPRVHDGAAVSESVELAKHVGLERASGLVNAVLRQVARRAQSIRFPSLEDDPVGYLVQWGSIPEWLARRWVEELGVEEAAELADACAREAPRTVRVSEGASLRNVRRRLGGRGCTWAPRGLTELERNPLSDPAFYRGEFTIQDEASQLVPLLLGAPKGATVVDCCAAPGAKAAQLAEQVGSQGEVIALDVNASRLRLVAGTAKRLRLENLRILERDAARGFDLRGQQLFDFVLVDAPCSGLGVLRRNPDARWRLAPEEVPRAAERAASILHSAARYVRPGGALVYSVCTFSPEETTELTRRFLESSGDYRIADPRLHLPAAAHELVDETGALRTWPHRHGCDAFYAVRLERQ
jgi:16S rRNA (cytosine967-C5)-methyltransferase